MSSALFIGSQCQHLPLLRVTSMMILSLGFVAFSENAALSELKELFSLLMHELSDWHNWGDRQLEAE